MTILTRDLHSYFAGITDDVASERGQLEQLFADYLAPCAQPIVRDRLTDLLTVVVAAALDGVGVELVDVDEV